jgi:hypothetical protein
MQLALKVQSTFLGMLHSTTARLLPHSALGFYSTETTTSTSQLEAHLQAALV